MGINSMFRKMREMRFTLKLKLLSAFFGIILFSSLLSILLNSTLLEKYYYEKKADILIQCYDNISKNFSNTDDILFEIDRNASLRGITTFIFDSNFNILYQSRLPRSTDSQQRRKTGTLRSDPSIHLDSSDFPESTMDKPIIKKQLDKTMDSYFISLYSKLDNDVYVFMGTPVKAIEESAFIATKFSVITGIFTLILGGIIILMITARLTRPITKLNRIAMKMAVLDFSERYNENNRDEIGTLGDSINSMSEQLEASIGELRQANQKLMEDIQNERRIDELRKEFISNISHELKTPIALIQGYSEGLKLNVNEDEDNKNYYCEVIEDEANKMNALVRKLLCLSELENTNVVLDRVDFDVTELIKDTLKKKTLEFARKGANIKFEYQEKAAVVINADYYLTEQVLQNYLSNALNHLSFSNDIIVGVEINKDKAVITVFNSGHNIPEDALENIWLSFYKVDKARTREYGGTGLGLSIVKAIQNAHNSCCGVRNVEGGVLFWFDAPLSQ